MIQPLFWGAFAAALLVLIWIGAGYLGVQWLALGITVLIAAFFLMGTMDLLRERRRSLALGAALRAPPGSGPGDGLVGADATPSALAAWLETLPGELRHAVAARIEGARLALPGPALAPYLTGLLVLLGMSGTFLGMVATLQGTGLALSGADGVAAIREALLTPVQGLGLAFGTSVAGVVASAMLGLMTALTRRERLEVTRALDAAIAGPLQRFTARHRQAESLRMLEHQAHWMPTVVEGLRTTMDALQRQHEVLAGRLAEDQRSFHAETGRVYGALAESVRETVQSGVTEGARQVQALLEPAVASTFAGLLREGAALREQMSAQVDRQLDALDARSLALTESLGVLIRGQSDTLAERWTQALDAPLRRLDELGGRQQEQLGRSVEAMSRFAEGVAATVEAGQTRLEARAAEQEGRREAAWREALEGLATRLAAHWQQHGDATRTRIEAIVTALQTAGEQAAGQFEAQGARLSGEVARLIELAGRSPEAVADLVEALQARMQDTQARDVALLEERGRLLESGARLTAQWTEAAEAQRAAIEALVSSGAAQMGDISARVNEAFNQQSVRVDGASAQLMRSAVEIASLGDAFGAAVQMYGQSNQQLLVQLQQVEAAINRSLSRSDEQLDYYVTQAREVVELSVGAQKQIIEDLHGLAERRARAEAGDAPRQAA